MKLEIVSERDNPLMRRREYWLSAEHLGKETPSRHEMLPQIAKKLGSKPELTLTDKIFSERGRAKSRVKVLVYKDKKDIPKEKLERQERKVKSYLEKKAGVKKAEEKPAEAPAPEGKEGEEKPAEEPAPEEKKDDTGEVEKEEEPKEEEKPEESAGKKEE